MYKSLTKTFSYLLENHTFAEVLNMYMEITLKSDKDLSIILNIPIPQVIDMRLGEIFGTVNKDICYKLDKAFETKKDFFYTMLKKSVVIKAD